MNQDFGCRFVEEGRLVQCPAPASSHMAATADGRAETEGLRKAARCAGLEGKGDGE